ncbi:hypothetical protein ACKKBF_B02150 [Auxenochlorella protothecoides x Auxenochlorella symbiontica]
MTASMGGCSCHASPSRLQGRMKAPGPCLVSPSLSKRRKFRLRAGAHPLQASMAPLRQCLMPVAAFVMAMHLHAGACSAAEVLIGTPRVIDGDTLEVWMVAVQLHVECRARVTRPPPVLQAPLCPTPFPPKIRWLAPACASSASTRPRRSRLAWTAGASPTSAARPPPPRSGR